MRIVLTEVSGLGGRGESVFEQAIIRVGRDPSQCQVVFDRATWPMVSRRHGEFRSEDGRCVLFDTNSSFGTFLDGQRLKAPAEVRVGSLVQFGTGGPLLRVSCVEPDAEAPEPAREETPRPYVPLGEDTQPFPAGSPASKEAPARPSPAPPLNRPQARPRLSPRPEASTSAAAELQATLYAAEGVGPAEQRQPALEEGRLRPLQLRAFGDAPYITVGRAHDNDIQLDSLQVSGHHARFVKDENGVLVEDRGSTNGVYLNGARVAAGRKAVRAEDVVQVGPFLLRADRERGVALYDTRSKTRIDAVALSKAVPGRDGGTLKLLDDVALTIQPNEFVGLLGPSGAGKSTLMDALNGMRPPAGGQVFVNDLDLYRNLDSLKHSIGYVPQDDIIHRELTVYRTLYYVARLRLSRDVSLRETDEIIEEVLEVTGLTERRDVTVGQLSGGQRKRVSIAVELLTKPSVIFLDEPTSGLDPATEEKIMKLFRRIAESGRTVVLTTHATANVHLFDKVVVMMQGKLVFYGTPAEALAHFRVEGFKDLYTALKSPGGAPWEGAAHRGGDEEAAEEWRRRFGATEAYRRNIALPRGELKPVRQADASAGPRLDMAGAVRQWALLVRRYVEIMTRDRSNLLVLLGQAPVIGFLIHLVVDAKAPRDFPYFTLALVATWFGSSLAAREIVKERAVYRRERMVNLGLLPYVASKVFTLALVVSAQCALLLGTLKALHYADLTYLPGSYGGLPQLLVMVLTGVVGLSLGLCVSAAVRTSETATSLVPLLLIPQILFSGLVGAPQGVARVASAAMPVTWSFDEMKRLSTLRTLNEEGSVARYVEEKGREGTKRAREEVEDYGRKSRESLEDYGRRVERYLTDVQADPGLARPRPPALGDAPRIADAPGADDLKEFVSFTHPWGGSAFDPFVLFVMVLLLIGGTVVVLRAQDAA